MRCVKYKPEGPILGLFSPGQPVRIDPPYICGLSVMRSRGLKLGLQAPHTNDQPLPLSTELCDTHHKQHALPSLRIEFTLYSTFFLLYFSFVIQSFCAAGFALLNLPKGKSLGRSKPATNCNTLCGIPTISKFF